MDCLDGRLSRGHGPWCEPLRCVNGGFTGGFTEGVLSAYIPTANPYFTFGVPARDRERLRHLSYYGSRAAREQRRHGECEPDSIQAAEPQPGGSRGAPTAVGKTPTEEHNPNPDLNFVMRSCLRGSQICGR